MGEMSEMCQNLGFSVLYCDFLRLYTLFGCLKSCQNRYFSYSFYDAGLYIIDRFIVFLKEISLISLFQAFLLLLIYFNSILFHLDLLKFHNRVLYGYAFFYNNNFLHNFLVTNAMSMKSVSIMRSM